jgi:thioredoxin 1
MSIEVTDQNFTQDVLQSPVPVLVDFWAPWCGPCRMMTPVMDELSKESEGRFRVAKCNVDENPLSASQHGVRSIPAFMLFKDGQLLDSKVGVLSKTQVLSWIEENM